jgi:hypothetical protein
LWPEDSVVGYDATSMSEQIALFWGNVWVSLPPRIGMSSELSTLQNDLSNPRTTESSVTPLRKPQTSHLPNPSILDLKKYNQSQDMLNVNVTDHTAATHLYPVDTNVPQEMIPSLFKSTNPYVRYHHHTLHYIRSQFPGMNNVLTPCSGVLPEKITGPQAVKKLPAFYGTPRVITKFTSARHCPSPKADQSSPCTPIPLLVEPF